MKHDSSARRKAYVPVVDPQPKERRLHLVPKPQMGAAKSNGRFGKQPFEADRLFYASDLFAIPFCLMWVLMYYLAAGSGHSADDTSLRHVLSSSTYHAAVTVLHWGEVIVRMIWSN
jgi:hypothetical protein